MKAIVFEKYGPPELLRYAEVPDPSPGAGDVLVRVKAASVNAGDMVVMRGRPPMLRLVFGLRRPKKRILGRAVAGTVEAVGPKVTAWKPGDEVVGEVSQLGFAEYVAAPAAHFVAIPEGVKHETAATLPIAATSALQALRVCRIADGHKVVVNGASGGVGTFAVQLAAQLGARVTAVCSGRNAAAATALGAERVVDYNREDFTDTAERYDAILDLVGNHPLSAVRRLIKPGGTYLTAGGGSDSFWGPFGRMIAIGAGGPFVPQRLRALASTRNGEDLAHLARLVAEGAITPAVERTCPLAEAPAAIADLEQEHARGKVVFTV
ncbi:NAD(P)-dependent alcohol dehydrogenase [Phytomonospora endophytica]|uniref:NADPH:quinone reductase-like Zn-dependent oxidoreductase n=1 Tax=Phytomonospora endophytica TaxID=714109 RepID=A0A841FQ28_9ACTN|nr:NAD(P)-dependent alcohol dehydrogenase [Phytomonospora endophytica]MBB6036943.1 NADPH:quinone reductase-like Zn-dependent oxidoreductase [Phytomonospora endophytica]GIG68026.1 NADPH:quinone reductase [Phytomonospora endophytica]